MSKAIEVNEIELYSKRICDFCDIKIAKYAMYFIKNEEQIASTLFCEECFDNFIQECSDFFSKGGNSKDEKCNM